MRLILSYFGEKLKIVENVTIASQSKMGTSDRGTKIIFEALMRSSMTLDELAVHLEILSQR